MSAINSSNGERDAIHRAQRAHEPSMEEILASIRNIIADDPLKGAAPPKSSPTPASQVVASTDSAGPSQRLDPPAPAVVWRRPQAVESELQIKDDGGDDGPALLLSPEASEATALSLGALTASLSVRSAELADEMVRETLRPMLKQWLDEHLPAVVERLVRAEIQRVARGAK